MATGVPVVWRPFKNPYYRCGGQGIILRLLADKYLGSHTNLATQEALKTVFSCFMVVLKRPYTRVKNVNREKCVVPFFVWKVAHIKSFTPVKEESPLDYTCDYIAFIHRKTVHV